MRIDLLGTGSADRWPNPWCSCPRCAWARSTGNHRARTSALVDRTVLIDPGPDAGAGGVDLTGVRTVLITHDHPDHLDPAFLLAWSWASGPRLTVAGPPQAIARCRDWVGPGAPVDFRELTADDEMLACDADGQRLRVRALAAAHSTRGGDQYDGTALLYEVGCASGALLYATDTAALPHDRLAGPFDVVLLELTFGDHTDHASAHLDLPSFGREVARLRAEGRLAADARVIAVHLSHHNPVDLGDRLAGIGAEVLPDGSTVLVGPQADGPGRRLLVTGGARSGKSRRAEQVVGGRSAVTYLATAPAYPDDPEWTARIAVHRERRPASWQVHETTEVAQALRAAAPGSTILVDCLTLWATALLDRAGAWDDASRAEEIMDAAIHDLVDALASTPADVVLVTNEVGAGIAPATSSGRLFRDLLGRANAAIAQVCDDVELVTSGIPQALKGRTWTTIST